MHVMHGTDFSISKFSAVFSKSNLDIQMAERLFLKGVNMVKDE